MVPHCLPRCCFRSGAAVEGISLLIPGFQRKIYAKFSVFHALEVCGKQQNTMDLCHSSIFILATYDRLHATNLLDTLHAFLFCHHSTAEASAKLFIHRNTMNNRMRRITALTGVDLQDAETTFYLILSFQILESYGATMSYWIWNAQGTADCERVKLAVLWR